MTVQHNHKHSLSRHPIVVTVGTWTYTFCKSLHEIWIQKGMSDTIDVLTCDPIEFNKIMALLTTHAA